MLFAGPKFIKVWAAVTMRHCRCILVLKEMRKYLHFKQQALALQQAINKKRLGKAAIENTVLDGANNLLSSQLWRKLTFTILCTKATCDLHVTWEGYRLI